MDLSQRIESFISLGIFLRDFSLNKQNDKYSLQLNEIVINDHIYNPWFVESNILQSIKAIGDSLKSENIEQWVKNYSKIKTYKGLKKIGIITAGNIPLVGFHDFFTVLISGNTFYGKLSTKDNRLLNFFVDYLIYLNNDFKNLISFTEDKLENIDAIIATGSNNTSRYFEYYFGKYPNIIRKNRNSVCVLTGNETKNDIEFLAKDIFSYFGLGCRNVSKIIVPKNYNFDFFFENIIKFESIINHNKYANNYNYNRSVYLMNQIKHLDNGFMLLKEDDGLSSPIGVLYFEYYKGIEQVEEYLTFNKEQIQCVVSNSEELNEVYPLGKAQQPELWDYADNIDTMEFLLNL